MLVCIFQSSLAAARADNFYYPPEWTPKQVRFLFNHISAVTIFNHICTDFQILTLLFHVSGVFEQISWSTCFERESKEIRSGHPYNKVGQLPKAFTFGALTLLLRCLFKTLFLKYFFQKIDKIYLNIWFSDQLGCIAFVGSRCLTIYGVVAATQ